MHEVVIFDGRGRRCAIDFDELRMDDGTRARDYAEPAALFRKLRAMKVPQITPQMGCYDLLLALGRYRAATKINQITGKLPVEGDAA
jgi:hypothetical protein